MICRNPIGATGARLSVILLHAMAKCGSRRGVASLYIGGREATAIAVAALIVGKNRCRGLNPHESRKATMRLAQLP
ncbi:hypothetical protein CN934_30760 [Ensifer sp. MMN_5]|nr:hypothetical protein CN934_30760 [Ensifer sp. MMN_5]